MQELCPKFKERFISKVVLDHNRENGVSQSCKFSLHSFITQAKSEST